MENKLKILFLLNKDKDIESIKCVLQKEKILFDQLAINSRKKFIKALVEFPADIIISEEKISIFTVLQALEILNKKEIKIPLILVSEQITAEQVMENIKAGASDYVNKNHLEKLPGALRSALEKYLKIKDQEEYLKRLEKAETRFRTLIENTVDAIVIINTDGMVTYASPSINRVLGYNEEEAMKFSIFDVVHPDDQQKIMEMIPECLEKPGISLPVMQYRSKHKNEKWIWFEGTITNMLHDPAINGIVHNFHDITLKKTALENLKENEEKYRSFFENSLDAILLTVTDGQVLAANPAACKMFQMSEEEICKAGRKGLLISEDKKFKEVFDLRKKNGKVKAILSFRRKDGSFFLGEISSSIFHDFTGTNRTSMIIRDISERVKAEEALKISEERYKFLFEYSTTPKWIFDLETDKIIDVNDTAVKHYGYRRDEFIGMETNNLKPPEEIARMAGINKNLKNMEGLIRFGIFTQVKKDGTKIKAEVSGYKCLFKDQQCMVIDSFDVTEREKILQQLKDSEEKLHTAQTIAKLGYWKRDLRKPEIFWSDELYKIASRNKETFKPTLETLVEIIHPDDRENYKRVRQETFERTNDLEIEYRIITPDGSIKWIHQNGKVIKDNNGNPIIFEGTARDVTSKKLLELSLEESNLRHKLVSKATSDVIWDWDFVKNKAFWGEGFKTIFGYNLDEIKPLDNFWEQNIHPDDRERVIKNIQAATDNPQSNWAIEYRFRRADNSYAYVLDKGFFIRDQSGKAIRLAGGMQDITERKELEELLDKSNKLARIGSYELNYNTGNLFWNSIAKSIYEVPENFEPTLNNISEFYSKDLSQEETIKAYNKAIENGTPFDLEVKIRTAKKNIRWIRLIGKTEFADGKINKIYGSIQDIDDRKKNEEALRLSIERYNLVTKATNDSIWDWDLVKNKVVRPGKSLENVLGYNHIHPDDVDDFWEKHVNHEDWQRISESRKILFNNPAANYWEDEYRFLKPDGSYAIIYDRAYISRDKNGKAVRMIGASRDISKIKESELQLKALNEKLEKRAKELVASNHELEQFAYVASHDLQEPLRMVTNFLTQIERKYNDLLDEKGKTYIYFAVDGAKRMRQMILDLLEFSRAGKIDNIEEEVDLNSLVQDIIELHQKKIEETNAKVIVEKLPAVTGSKTGLRQVFQNLISNCLKYNQQKNGIIPEILISSKDHKDYWEMEVKDNGIGIDAPYFEKIFVIFQRLHDRSEYPGTGIGLAITKKIIENLEGKIWVESELGKGSSFYFTIPKKSNIYYLKND